MKKMIGLVVSVSMVGLIAATGCSSGIGSLCPSGEVQCGDGCMPETSVCCGSSGYCPSGDSCGPNNTCLPPVVNNAEQACQYCLSTGQECCANTDLTVDCAPPGSICCGNHTHCNPGTNCVCQ